MKTHETIKIIYFSGTGGTYRVAQHFYEEFAKMGKSVTISELTMSSILDQQLSQIEESLLILLYPVYAFSAPLSIHEWLDGLKTHLNKEVVICSVSGGGELFPNTASRTLVKRQLERKGFRVIYEKMFVMPGNVAIQYDLELMALLLQKAPLMVKKVIRELEKGVERLTRPLLIDRILVRLFMFQKKAGRKFSDKFTVDDGCNGCSLCESQCPRANIQMQNGKPTFNSNCVICMKCIYNCPKHSIHPRFEKKLVLKNGYDLDQIDDMIKRSEAVNPAYVPPKGVLFKGVVKYLEESTES